MARRQVPERGLEELGLSGSEARAYLALLDAGAAGAQAIADAVGISRAGTYPVLRALKDKGLVDHGEGWGSLYRAVGPEVALPLLVDRQRQEVEEREIAAKELAEELAERVTPASAASHEIFEVIRNQRSQAERFARFELAAEKEIDLIVKPPIIDRSGNPEEESALKRGVRVRALYQQSVLEDEAVGPYLTDWLAMGEEARVYPGELPLKLALFDRRTALVPLETPASPHSLTAIVVNHPALGAALRIFFDASWAESEPLER